MTRRGGFTLFELMITVSIIGVLSAALYPSLSEYLERGRDATRISDMGSMKTALYSHYVSNEYYPSYTNSGCMDSTVITDRYMPSGVPMSPGGDEYDEGCGPYGHYGYGLSVGSGYHILTSITENPYGGNYSGSILGMTGLITDEEGTPREQKKFFLARDQTKKGAGSGYILVEGIFLRAVPTAIVVPGGGTPPPPPPTSPSINGTCGGDAEPYGCSFGIKSNEVNSTTCDEMRTWTCSGTNGGSPASCTKPNPACICNIGPTTLIGSCIIQPSSL